MLETICNLGFHFRKVLIVFWVFLWLSQLLAMISREVPTIALTIGMCFFEQTLSFLQDWILGTFTLSKRFLKNLGSDTFVYILGSYICIQCVPVYAYFVPAAVFLVPVSVLLITKSVFLFFIRTSNLGFCICFPGSCFCSCIFGSRIFTIDY